MPKKSKKETEEIDMVSFEPEPDNAEGMEKIQDDSKNELAVKILKQVHESLGHVLELLEGNQSAEAARQLADLVTSKKDLEQQMEDLSGARTVEGVFDGCSMVGTDGKLYSVPPNYASKSRLVEGDVMKLTIKPDGSFLYKQIGPVERVRQVAKLALDKASGEFIAVCEEGDCKLLNASVTYFKGEPGDEAVILVPKSGKNIWAAVENIVKK